MYEGNPNNPGYRDNNGVYHPGDGPFFSVQGNVCYGDNGNLGFTQGAGVSSSSRDDVDPRFSASDFLWVKYTVNFRDHRPYGSLLFVLVPVLPEQRLPMDEGQAVPGGVCNHDSRGPAPFIKMPKIQFTVSGPEMDYWAESC